MAKHVKVNSFLLTAVMVVMPISSIFASEHPIQKTNEYVSYRDGETITSKSIIDYYENGLIQDITDDASRVSVKYQFDSNGNPISIELLSDEGETETRIIIENTYDNGEITKADIVEIYVDGNYYNDSDFDDSLRLPDEVPLYIFDSIATCMACLEQYSGYQNTEFGCTCLSLGDTMRFSSGELVYRCLVSGQLKQEDKTFFDIESGETTNITRYSMWEDGIWEESTYRSITTDEMDICKRRSENSEVGGESIEYDINIDFDSEQTVLTGKCSNGIYRYWMIDERVVKSEFEELSNGSREITFYDDLGRIIKTQAGVDGSYINITEYEY